MQSAASMSAGLTTRANLSRLAVTNKRSPTVCARHACLCAARSYEPSTPQQTEDEMYMRLALQHAQAAFNAGEVPIGAIIVSESETIGKGQNETEGQQNPLAHAELQCIMSAAQSMQAWRLQDATLYCTVEPCPMCAGAILQARVKRLVYGARQPRLGADGSWVALFPEQSADIGASAQKGKDKQSSTKLSTQEIAARTPPAVAATPAVQATTTQEATAPQAARRSGWAADRPIKPVGNHAFHKSITVTRGVLEQECKELMVNFFRQRRQQQKAAKEAKVAATAIAMAVMAALSRTCAVAPTLNIPQHLKLTLQPDSNLLGLDAALSACLAAACVGDIHAQLVCTSTDLSTQPVVVNSECLHNGRATATSSQQ